MVVCSANSQPDEFRMAIETACEQPHRIGGGHVPGGTDIDYGHSTETTP
jgi:hypothetical protein